MRWWGLGLSVSTSHSTHSESAHCSLSLSERPELYTFTFSELGGGTLQVVITPSAAGSSRWKCRVHRLFAMVNATQNTTLESLGVGEAIKQYPGQIQVTRAVKVKAPGKHFTTTCEAQRPLLTTGRRRRMEYKERYGFELHAKAWGTAHTGPGIRFICDSDAVDDPDHKGFWATLALWNRWRHNTYTRTIGRRRSCTSTSCPPLQSPWRPPRKRRQSRKPRSGSSSRTALDSGLAELGNPLYSLSTVFTEWRAGGPHFHCK